MDYLALVDELVIPVMPMRPYHPVLGLPWFQKRNHNIHWARRRLTCLQLQGASGVEEVTPMTMAVASTVSQAENDNINDQLVRCGPDTQTLGATLFEDPLASDEVVTAFALQIRECTGLLGATVEGITLDSPGDTDLSARRDEQGAAVVVVAEEPLTGATCLTATTPPRPQESDWSARLGSCVSEPLTARPPGFLLSSFLLLHLLVHEHLS